MSPTLSSDPRVDQAIAELPDEVRVVAEALRRMVRANAPTLREVLKWGNPTWVGRGNAINLMLFAHHVNLGLFRGAELAARFPEIEGTGKSLRHVKVPDLPAARRPVLAKIVRAAVALDSAGP